VEGGDAPPELSSVPTTNSGHALSECFASTAPARCRWLGVVGYPGGGGGLDRRGSHNVRHPQTSRLSRFGPIMGKGLGEQYRREVESIGETMLNHNAASSIPPSEDTLGRPT